MGIQTNFHAARMSAAGEGSTEPLHNLIESLILAIQPGSVLFVSIESLILATQWVVSFLLAADLGLWRNGR